MEGEASARLLPFPSVTFKNVSVAGDSDGIPFLTIDEFRMNAELAPYLSGEIRIFAMALDNPVLRLGYDDVSLPRPVIPTEAEVVLEDVRIANGAIVFAADSDIAGTGISRLDNLNANISADSLSGPFEGTGRFDLSGDEVNFALDVGQSDEESAAPLRLTFASAAHSAELQFDGRIIEADGRKRFDGRLDYVQPIAQATTDEGEEGKDAAFALLSDPQLDDDDLGGLRGSVAGEGEKNSKPPLRASARVSIADDRLTSDSLRVEVGDRRVPYVLSGGGFVSLEDGAPRFQLILEGESFDVDSINDAAEEKAPSEAAGLPSRLEALRQVLLLAPKPTIDGVIELTLPVVTFGDTTIRSLAFRAEPRPQGWQLRNLSAEVPGRTLLEADGVLNLEPALGFSGDLLIASRQPSGLSDWLTGNVDPTIRTLERAGLAARVDLTAERQTFRELELDLGGEVLTGLIERVPNVAGGRLTARLQGGEVDLDALRAIGAMATGSDNLLTSVERYDVALTAGPVRLKDIEADHVDADILYDGAILAIAQLDVEGLAGASFSATGQLLELGADVEGQIDLTLRSDDPETFFDFLERMRPDTPLVSVLKSRAATLAPLSLSGEVESIEHGNGAPTLLLRLDGTAAETQVDFSAAVENGFRAIETSGRVGLDIRLESDAPESLLRQLGLPANGNAIEGPLEVESSISASSRGPAVISATLRTPRTDASLEGVLDLTDAGVENVDSSLRLSSQSLGPWIDMFDIELGLDAETRRQLDADLSASIARQGPLWKVTSLSGALGGTAIQSDFTLAPNGVVEGSLRTSDLSLPWLANLVYGVDVLSQGERIWSSTPFTNALLPDIPIALDVRVERMDAAGVPIRDVAFAFASSKREMSLSALSGTLLKGDVRGEIIMRNLDGLGSLSADLRMDEIGLSELTPSLVAAGADSDLTVTAKLDSTAQSAAGLIASSNGAGELTAVRLAIPGIPSNPFAALLAAADEEGFTAGEDVGAAFDALSQGASFPVSRVTSGYSVSAGNLALSPVTVSAQGSDLTISGRFDLSTFDLDADMQLAIDPGEDAVEGAQPEVRYEATGPIEAPILSRDDAALANYLSVRALEREQARVEAMQERLQETLRLRREARFYRWLDRAKEEAEAEEARQAAARQEAEAAAISAAREEADTAPAPQPPEAVPTPAAPPAERPAPPLPEPEPSPEPVEPAVSDNADGDNDPVASRPTRSNSVKPDVTLDFGNGEDPAGSMAQDGFSGLPGVADPLQF